MECESFIFNGCYAMINVEVFIYSTDVDADAAVLDPGHLSRLDKN